MAACACSTLRPRRSVCRAPSLADLRGGDPAANAEAIRALLGGAAGPYRDIVLLNTAAALLVADKVETLQEGVALAASVDRRRPRRDGAGPSWSRSPTGVTHERHPRADRRLQARRGRRRARRAETQDAVEAERAAASAAARLSRRPRSAACARPPGPDRRDQEGLAVQGPDPRRLRPAGAGRGPIERGGAACLSVLTDAPSFQGADAYLTAARDADRPARACARSSWSIPGRWRSHARSGADAILVILAISDDSLAAELLAEAARFGMDALVEAHDEAEVDRAVAPRRAPDRRQQPRPSHLRHRPGRHRAAGRPHPAGSPAGHRKRHLHRRRRRAPGRGRRPRHAGRRKPDAADERRSCNARAARLTRAVR